MIDTAIQQMLSSGLSGAEVAARALEAVTSKSRYPAEGLIQLYNNHLGKLLAHNDDWYVAPNFEVDPSDSTHNEFIVWHEDQRVAQFFVTEEQER